MNRRLEIETELRDLINSYDFDRTQGILIGYKAEGFSSSDISEILTAILPDVIDNDALYDNFLNIADIATGWCRKELRVWER